MPLSPKPINTPNKPLFSMLAPPLVTLDQLTDHLSAHGHAELSAASVSTLARCNLADLLSLRSFWNDLPPDRFLRDGGRYRFRRHSCFVVNQGNVQQVVHRAHWQPVEYNALHGGIERLFEPMLTALVEHPAWRQLLIGLASSANAIKGAQAWFIEAHQFRIDTSDGIGRPTPEGAHRDGVDFVAVFLLDRHGIKGGETRVFEANSPAGLRFTLSEPWSVMLLDDERVIHESTPIQPLDEHGWRDTLVITLRSGGFQGPAAI